MKITKRAKKVKVHYYKTVSYYSSYTCPACGINLIGTGIGENILRFKCDCGQELIVDNGEDNKKGGI